MFVIKADGTQERFDEKKIVRTCIRSGVSRETAEEIARDIKRSISDGTTTHEIYKMILSSLRRLEKVPAFVFRLREALSEMDSTSFEIYTKKLLEACGYKCRWDVLIRGNCVEHQVDVIAEKKGLFLVECKHHINHHRFCGLGNVLQVQARMEDINDGFRYGKNKYNFKKAWIVTNTKFSDHAKKYARGKGIILTGWGGPNPLEKIIESQKAFPITLLDVDDATKLRLLDKKIITLQDLLFFGRLIKKLRLEKSIKQVETLLTKK